MVLCKEITEIDLHEPAYGSVSVSVAPDCTDSAGVQTLLIVEVGFRDGDEVGQERVHGFFLVSHVSRGDRR